MDLGNEVDVVHLQRSRSTILDLSVGCNQRPLKTNCTETLHLVKKSTWCDIPSGRTRNETESRSSRYVTQPCNPNAPDHTEPHRSRGSSNNIPFLSLPVLDEVPSMAQVLSQYQHAEQVFADDGDDCSMETDSVLMEPQKLCRKADSSLENGTVGNTMQCKGLETHQQNALTSSGKTYFNDTVSVISQTKGSSILSQDTDAATCTKLSKRITVELTPVETLKTECAASKESSTCVVISSDDDSDIIEVPTTNCKTPPNRCFRFRGIKNEINHGKEKTASKSRKISSNHLMSCPPKNVGDKTHFKANEAKSLLSWMESVMKPIIPQDRDQDIDTAFSKLLPSTLEAESTGFLKSPPSSTSSSMSRQPLKTSATKNRKQSKPRPKKKKPHQRFRVLSGSKSSANAPKRARRKRCASRTSSMFSPPEPEIKLKYLNHKENKRDPKVDGFAPYIHMEFSSCTVVNFRKEDYVETMKESKQGVSGTIPNTSCLQLGRFNSDDRFQVRHFCSLCGRAASNEGLGDLHGPYYPSGVQLNTSPSARRQDVEYSDVESVYSLDVGVPQYIKQTGAFLVSSKLQKKDNCVKKIEESDAYSGRWIHEDCSIWTAGVFLVKGKLYGLEEAIWRSQGTMCSHCHRVGATLGCFFKDCPNKYHFPCTLNSDSALCEENFTIRCPKHKTAALFL